MYFRQKLDYCYNNRVILDIDKLLSFTEKSNYNFLYPIKTETVPHYWWIGHIIDIV